MKIRTSVLCLLVTCCCCFVTASRFDPSTVKPIGKPPSRYLNATEMIEYYGYKSSGYTVETEDGYSLHLLRMGSNKGPPVLLVNGFGALPEGLLVYGPYHSLPYVLHDLGYDIWFPAKRGIYSKHKTLKFTDPKFWDFSHDEIGMYDMPPQIDQVMQVTGHNKLLYIGVSQGSAIFMSLCSLRPSYCDLFVGSVQIVPAMNIPSLSELSPAARLSWFSSRSIYVANRLLGIPYLAVDGKTIWETNICVRMETLCLGLLNLANGVVKKQVYEDGS